MDGNGVRADVDGIRALGELSRRQATHIDNVEFYMQDTCRASGAFRGVMTFFQGTYSQVLAHASEGLTGAQRAHEFAAENFTKCAEEYQNADRLAYDVLARLAGGAGWDIAPYRPTGSGDASLQAGSCVQAPANADPETSGEGSSVGDDLQTKAIAEGKGVAKHFTREVVEVDGRRMFKDDVPKDVETGDWIKRASDRLDRVTDPFNVGEKIDKVKSDYVDQSVKDVHESGTKFGDLTQRGARMQEDAPNTVGAGSIRNDIGHSHEQNLDLHDNARNAVGWVEQGLAQKSWVEGMMDDPSGGVGDSVDQLQEAWGNAQEVRRAADGPVDSSALDWGARR